MNALELPAGANPARDRVVGRDELGRTIRKTLMGATYTTGEGYAPKPSAPSLFDVIAEPSRLVAGGGSNMATTQTPPQGSPSQGLGPVVGLLNSIWDTVSIPGDAARGREPTLGGLLDLASMVQLGGAPMPAPQGSLRSGSIIDEYAGSHRAPKIEVGATLDNPTVVFGSDIYSPNAQRYFGTGNDAMDTESIRTIQKMRGNPNAKVSIYRAIPSSAKSDFNSGDWVTTSRQYAVDHGDSALGGDYKIIEKKVNASELATDGNSIHEWGWWGK